MSFKKAGSGDDGFSRLYDGTKLQKSDDIFEALGDIDELNSIIGVFIDDIKDKEIYDILENIQGKLIELGSHIATPRTDKNLNNNKDKIQKTEFPDYYTELEQVIFDIDNSLPKLTKFILPRGYANYIRTVARRVERRIVPLYNKEICSQNCIKYVNRLSDLFFVLGRKTHEDIVYISK